MPELELPPEPITKTPAPTVEEKLTKSIEGLLAKHGDPNAALRTVLNENYEYRDKLRSFEASKPVDGSLVLSPDEAKSYKSYQALGDPKEVAKELETTRADSRSLAEIKANDALKGLAGKAGYNPEVFATLAKRDGLTLVSKEVKGADGKTVEKVFTTGADGAETPIETHAEKNWAAFADSLKPRTQSSLGTAPRYTPPPSPDKPATQPKRRSTF